MSDSNPYPGPRPLRWGERIYGRDREIADLYYQLLAERIVMLHSPSGAGKSSLVQAGLIPRLEEHFDVWPVTRVNQQPPPDFTGNRFLYSAISGFGAGAAQETGSLVSYVAERCRQFGEPNYPPLLIFDQFEEVLTADAAADSAREDVFTQLGTLLHDPAIWALFIVREDYIAPLEAWALRVPTQLKNRFRIDRLRRDAATKAVEGPAKDTGRVFSREAADALVDNLSSVQVQGADGRFRRQLGEYVEPVHLQVVCRRLWERLPDAEREIGLAHVEDLADPGSALMEFYDRAVLKAASHVASQRQIRQWIGEHLITAAGARTQVQLEEERTRGLPNEAIERLQREHIIRAEPRSGAIWYELSHDRLLEPIITSNAKWFDDHLVPVQKTVEIWRRQTPRPTGLLVVDNELAAAEQWAASGAALTTDEEQFLNACRAHQTLVNERRSRERLIRLLLATATVLMVVAAALWWRAEVRKLQARSFGLAVTAGALSDRFLAAMILREAGPRTADLNPVEAARIAHWALSDPRPEALLTGHSDEIRNVAFSPDGEKIVTASFDGTARIWNADGTGEAVELRGHSRTGSISGV